MAAGVLVWRGSRGWAGETEQGTDTHMVIFLLFQFAMEPNYLHIWPRNTFMMIALPNMVIIRGHAPVGHGMELVGINWLWWQGLGGMAQCQEGTPDPLGLGRGAGQDPQSCLCLTAPSRYLCTPLPCT